MNPKEIPLTERTQSSFQHLAVLASQLNAASDELTKPIEELDTDLKQLNLGIPAWVTISKSEDESGEYWSTEEIGYTKLNNKWGIALRTCSGDYSYPPGDTANEWHFADAPRGLRIRGIEHIPALLDEFGKTGASNHFPDQGEDRWRKNSRRPSGKRCLNRRRGRDKSRTQPEMLVHGTHHPCRMRSRHRLDFRRLLRFA